MTAHKCSSEGTAVHCRFCQMIDGDAEIWKLKLVWTKVLPAAEAVLSNLVAFSRYQVFKIVQISGHDSFTLSS